MTDEIRKLLTQLAERVRVGDRDGAAAIVAELEELDRRLARRQNGMDEAAARESVGLAPKTAGWTGTKEED